MAELRRYEGIQEGDPQWPYYFYANVNFVDDDYASCLSLSLERSLETLERALSTVREGETVGTLRGPFGLTRGQLQAVDVAELKRLSFWIGRGGFDVFPPPPGPDNSVIFSRAA